jgi:hypothetical protein
MAHELVGQDRGIVKDFDDVDGERRDLGQHDAPQRVGRLEVEVLDNKVGALVVGLCMAVSVAGRRDHWQSGRCTWRKRTLIAPPSGS